WPSARFVELRYDDSYLGCKLGSRSNSARASKLRNQSYIRPCWRCARHGGDGSHSSVVAGEPLERCTAKVARPSELGESIDYDDPPRLRGMVTTRRFRHDKVHPTRPHTAKAERITGP